MGRSSAEQASRNRIRILESASRLFRARGVEAVAVAEVMAEAGLTVGGFYRHFASKEELVREACALSFAQAAAFWRGAAGGAEDPQEDRILTILRHYFRPRPGDRACPLLAYAPHLSGEAEPPAREAYGAGAGALLAEFLARTPEADPEARREAQVIFAAMVGAQLLARASGGADWAKELQEAVAGAAARR
ncbi:TetR/AcrR family transcriptional regulator [Neomegalonema sp.]|uniref:TetR/AcrR family transcriptional regulator n=1 Tax=Neomegalonema sp. TaxID=2039713 RepID=UPI0026088481|nr:TetR family transcriptional regulator [Neomegalonema sp.]MDD2867781.1 TetR family transcriptional regulator [Neomegalonema sp.]